MEVGGNTIDDDETELIGQLNLQDDNPADDKNQINERTNLNSNGSLVENKSADAIEIAEKQEETNPEEKLCGWLHHRAKGIGNLKGNRQRWFVFSEENCKLYMYRHPDDLCPVGDFNIDTASFYFDGGNIDRPGIFEIKTDGKDVFLDAGTRHNMMFWLQALQNKRKMFNLSRGFPALNSGGLRPQKNRRQYGGLIAKEADPSLTTQMAFDQSRIGVDSIPEIRLTLSETSGSNSSLNSMPSSKNMLSSGLSAIQSKLNSFKRPGRTQKETAQEPNNKPFSFERKNQDAMSTSTVSVNSQDSLVITGEDGTQSVSSCEDNKDRSHSQLSTYSDGSDFGLLRDLSNNSESRINTGSWTLINDNEAKGAQSEIDRDDFSRNSKSTFYTGNGEGDNGQSIERSDSESDQGRTGKFLSTLKKIRIGKRQISEPATGVTKTQNCNTVCPKCKRPLSQNVQGSQSVQNDVGSLKDYEDLEVELTANREIVEILHKQLDGLQKELSLREKIADLDDQGKTDLLIEKEILVTDLNDQLAVIKQEYAVTTEKLQSVEEEFSASKEQLAMYEDMLKAKDETIISLSTQLFDKEHQAFPGIDQSESVQPLLDLGTSASYEKEVSRMKDMCQGYELQHKFLTKEILELNELRKMDLAREKKLKEDLAKLEAKFCQVKSKYFVLLKQTKEHMPVRGDEDGHEVVSQLIQDAMEADEDDVELRLTGSIQEYDSYGFSRKQFLYEEEQDVDIDPLSNKAAVLERQSEELSSQVKHADLEASLRVKWENLLIGRGGKLTRNNELKGLIRLGVPADHRMDVWKGLINLYVGAKREEVGPDHYINLLQRKQEETMKSDPSIKQIELDLLRTLPNNKHYEDIESVGIIKLRNVLLAYSEYNKHIGYCQGLNRIAAIALLILEEEDAFWCLVAIVDYILPPEYFSTSLMAAQADQRVLKDIVQEKLPKIHAHLERLHVDMSLFAFNWFLTIFIDNIPTEMFLRIWDTMLCEGSKVLFRFAVAFLKKSEQEILQQDDGLKLNRYLRSIGQKMTDVKLISNYAFSWINPFPMRFIANRRQFHIQQIKNELSELDKIRHGLKVNRQTEREEEFFSDDDLDS